MPAKPWKTLRVLVEMKVPEGHQITETRFTKDVQQVLDSFDARHPFEDNPTRPRAVSYSKKKRHL